MAVSHKHPSDTTSLPAQQTATEGDAQQGTQDLIAETTAARREGDPRAAGVRELLRRAGQRNRAALDRLAR